MNLSYTHLTDVYYLSLAQANGIIKYKPVQTEITSTNWNFNWKY